MKQIALILFIFMTFGLGSCIEENINPVPQLEDENGTVLVTTTQPIEGPVLVYKVDGGGDDENDGGSMPPPPGP
ncbi:MAG: hypothetical protein ACPGJS_08630 [Flammeovirgaceae bacterium]